jgi:hypothetical protein
VREFALSDVFPSEALTKIIVRSPANAAVNVMQPFVIAVNVVYTGDKGPKPKCVRRD